MIRPVLWLLVDVAVGLVVAGVVSPWAIALVPQSYRGTLALGGVALVCVAGVSCCRRILGLGAGESPR